MNLLRNVLTGIRRRKAVSPDVLHRSSFKRCLNAIDLTGIGVSVGAGLGVYVAVPHVARDEAGPAAVLSVIIAGVTALLCGLCYAECSSRLPRAGSVYVYTYTVFGELAAFVVGWTLVLEYILVGAVSGKAWGNYLDYLSGGQIKRTLSQKMLLALGSQFDDHLDLPALSVIVAAVFISALLAKSLAVFVVTLIVVSVLVAMAIICVGFFHVDSQNWKEPPGFFPNGFIGVLQGSAACLVSFIGIDAVANLAEDTRVPCKMIPKAISTVFLCLFVLFFGLSLALTLVCNWRNLPSTVALAKCYYAGGISGSNYVIGVGGLIALLASVLCAMYSLPRALYAMANDGLIPKCLSFVSEVTQAPVLASCLGGSVSAVAAMLLCMDSLIHMLSIGTVLAFGLTSVCALLLRYDPRVIGLYKEYEELYDMIQSTKFDTDDSDQAARLARRLTNAESIHEHSDFLFAEAPQSGNCLVGSSDDNIATQYSETSGLSRTSGSNHDMQIHPIPRQSDSDSRAMTPIIKSSRLKRKMYVMVNSPSMSSVVTTISEHDSSPSADSLRVVKTATLVLSAATLSMAILTLCGSTYLANTHWWAICFLTLFVVCISVSIYFISKEPKNHTKLLYSTPYVPFTPIAGLILTILLAVALPSLAWIRFGVWTAIGLVVYLSYGLRNSRELTPEEEDVVLYDVTEDRGRIDTS